MTKRAPTMKLPEKPSEPEADLGRLSMLLYGREGIGKTTLAAQFPDALFLCFEPGARHLRVFREDVSTWKEFKAWVQAIHADADRFSTIVIDTVDLAFDRCLEYTCSRMGIDHPSDEDFGKGWEAVRREFASVLVPLMNYGGGVIFISHETDKSFNKRGGGKEDRILPSLPKTGRKVVADAVEIVAYYSFDEGGERRLHLQGDELIYAKNRWADLFATNIIPCGSSSEEAYRNFESAFNGEAPVTPKKDKTTPTRKRRRRSAGA